MGHLRLDPWCCFRWQRDLPDMRVASGHGFDFERAWRDRGYRRWTRRIVWIRSSARARPNLEEKAYRCPCLSVDEDVMRKKAEQEWNVRLTEVSTFGTLHSPYCITHLYTTNTEFNESTEHFTPRNLVRRTTNGDLDKQRVVVRLERNNV